MIPVPGCDPRVNVVSLGAEILLRLRDGPIAVGDIFSECSRNLGVSIDHVILSMDWLHMIFAIRFDGDKVVLV